MRGLLGIFLAVAGAWGQSSLKSPDGAIEMTISSDRGLSYTVNYHGKPVILRSTLGLELAGQPVLGGAVRILNVQPGSLDESYTAITGKANPVRNFCRTLTVELEETAAPSRKMTLEAHAYKDGVAFRYFVPEQAGLQDVKLASERTQFKVAKDGTTWPLIVEGFQSSYEDNYHVLPVSGIHPNDLVALPLLAELPGVARVGITEAPWHVILIGDEPGRLIESNIETNLNPPSAISDTSWIKPGRNTSTMEHYIDFCAENGLPYMLIDAGWAAHGTGQNDSNADLLHTNPNIEMPAILEHAKQKNCAWLWAHWSDIEHQMADAFPLFERWGIAGVKIDFHGAYKPDGINLTWPNLVTREGVMGAEYNKWSGRVTPEHNTTLPFTRMLAGPLDYTSGGFNNATAAEFKPQNTRPMVMTTRAHQLALYVILETGLQMLADYPEIYKGQPETKFLRDVPVVWNETRVVGVRPANYATIARRNGREWYVGSITASHAKELDIPLEFLGKGDYIAEIYSDAPAAASAPKHATKEEKRLTAATVLHVKMVPAGGQAIRIRRAQ
jgi:alpha-glucosidase